MKKFGAAALLAAVILGAGVATPASAATPTAGAVNSGSSFQLYGNWPSPS